MFNPFPTRCIDVKCTPLAGVQTKNHILHQTFYLVPPTLVTKFNFYSPLNRLIDLDLFGQSQIVCSFKWPLCFEQIICQWLITSSHHTQSGILLGVWYLATRLHDPAIFIPPQLDVLCNFVMKAWNDVDAETVIKSFKNVSHLLDGMDNYLWKEEAGATPSDLEFDPYDDCLINILQDVIDSYDEGF